MSSTPFTILKDPQAVLDYRVEWTTWLSDVSDTISTGTVTATTGITVDSYNVNGTQLIGWLSGGTAGSEYTITYQITTTGGRTDQRELVVRVQNR